MSFLEIVLFYIEHSFRSNRLSLMSMSDTSMSVDVNEEGLPLGDLTVDMIVPSPIDDHATMGVQV